MLEPIPETVEAMAEYLSLADPDLDQTFVEMGQIAATIVPELVGLSLALVQDGLTFTLAAPNLGIASLDAVQYIDDGPCVEAAEQGGPVLTDTEDLLDEDRWHYYARTAAAAGVASSLSMPILHDGQVTGGLNLYASAPHAFEGREQALADALGASADLAVTNADLSFASRLNAVQAPEILRDSVAIDHAIGLLAGRYGESVAQARVRLERAAARAGVPVVVSARIIASVHSGGSDLS